MNLMPTNDKEKPKVKIVYRDRPLPPPPEESFMMNSMRLLKKDHNWKILIGIAIGFLANALFG
jgi:hypothetical protein